MFIYPCIHTHTHLLTHARNIYDARKRNVQQEVCKVATELRRIVNKITHKINSMIFDSVCNIMPENSNGTENPLKFSTLHHYKPYICKLITCDKAKM